MLGFNRRNLKCCPQRLKELYIFMVKSGVEYASLVWAPSAQFEINSLEKVQHRAARFVTHQYRRKLESKLTSAEKWNTLQTRWTAARLTMLYKATRSEVTLPTHHLQKACTRTRSFTVQYIMVWTVTLMGVTNIQMNLHDQLKMIFSFYLLNASGYTLSDITQ